MSQFGFFKTHSAFFRKLLGLIIIASVGYMIYLERGGNIANAGTVSTSTPLQLQNGLSAPYPAPEIAGITAWINSPPLTMSELRGKVVLIDFWTFSCINCIRTLPYLKSWYDKYRDKGFVIIGVQAPEFEFEKDLSNVQNAVTQDGIKYPVALDNQFVTWRNFHNSYWPAHYLIDKEGNVVYTHFGEGEYDVTENNIRYLLGIASAAAPQADTSQSSFFQSPETYFGYARAEHFSSPETVAQDEMTHYSFPKRLGKNEWALSGNWKIMNDRIVSGTGESVLQFRFYARRVFVVMGNASEKEITVKVTLDGNAVSAEHGKDVSNSEIHVGRHTLYDVIEFKDARGAVLQLSASAPGLELYTFTFGR